MTIISSSTSWRFATRFARSSSSSITTCCCRPSIRSLRWRKKADEVVAAFGGRRWVFPQGDCRLLPVANTTAELLAAYIGRCSGMRSVSVADWSRSHASRRAGRVRGADRRFGNRASRASPATPLTLAQSAFFLKRRVPRRPIRTGGMRFAPSAAACTSLPMLAFAPMPDVHNAAVLLMSLPEEEASTMLGKLDSKQVEQVSIEIARHAERLGRRTGQGHPRVRRDDAQLRRGRRRTGSGQGAAAEGARLRRQRRAGHRFASRSKRCRSLSCGKSTAKTSSPTSSTSIRRRSRWSCRTCRRASARRFSPACPRRSGSRSCGGSPRWARRRPRSSARSKRRSKAGCRA